MPCLFFTLYTPLHPETLQLIILCVCGPLGLKNPSVFSSSISLEITAQEEALCTGHVSRLPVTVLLVCESSLFLVPWTETLWEQELSSKPTCLSRI